nr:PREDICTED: uncharacterized protein LOC105672609 isoform X2 [Linepithema humile]
MLYKQTDETNFNQIYLNVIIMNRLEENQVITAISSSFYKNVFLLTRVLPPSSEFQQCFKKNMFDKPNTMGFLHVSHYLSVIYDSKLFKQMVSWPVLCKKDEVKYRTEIKDFFFVLSQDNPDINFPPVLMSHLIQSGGTRFLIIMWKLSQLALRAYIKREFQEELLYAPRTSPLDDLTITYFNNIIAEKHNVMTETHKKTKRVLDAANNFLHNEIKILSVYKSEIFDRRENLKRVVSNLLTYPLIQEQLMNVEDSKIISLWKIEILKKMQYIRRKNEKLKKLEDSCNRLCKLIVGINSNSEILDGNKFPKVNCDSYLQLLEQYERMAVTPCTFYQI